MNCSHIEKNTSIFFSLCNSHDALPFRCVIQGYGSNHLKLNSKITLSLNCTVGVHRIDVIIVLWSSQPNVPLRPVEHDVNAKVAGLDWRNHENPPHIVKCNEWNPFRYSLFTINVITRIIFGNNWIAMSSTIDNDQLVELPLGNCVELLNRKSSAAFKIVSLGACRWPLLFHLLFCAWIYAEIKTSTRLIYVAWFMESGSRAKREKKSRTQMINCYQRRR